MFGSLGGMRYRAGLCVALHLFGIWPFAGIILATACDIHLPVLAISFNMGAGNMVG
jgi:hypothetical protein